MVQPCVSYLIPLERESLTISTAAAQMLKRLFCVSDSCLGEAYVPGCLASGDLQIGFILLSSIPVPQDSGWNTDLSAARNENKIIKMVKMTPGRRAGQRLVGGILTLIGYQRAGVRGCPCLLGKGISEKGGITKKAHPLVLAEKNSPYPPPKELDPDGQIQSLRFFGLGNLLQAPGRWAALDLPSALAAAQLSHGNVPLRLCGCCRNSIFLWQLSSNMPHPGKLPALLFLPSHL